MDAHQTLEHVNAVGQFGAIPAQSGEYWGRIFRRNPEFCSWQALQQSQVLAEVCRNICDQPDTVRTLDFGVGSLGLYRAVDPALMRRIVLTGISESLQHDGNDPFIKRHGIQVIVGEGLTPFSQVPFNAFELVLCSYVFAYLSKTMRMHTLEAFARALVAGGKLVLVLHHPRGERARKFKLADTYWPRARTLYQLLLHDEFQGAEALLDELNRFLSETFASDHSFKDYLSSYLRTARQFLAMLSQTKTSELTWMAEARSDCAETLGLIDREFSMTCENFEPVADPLHDLIMPKGMRLDAITECFDLSSGYPIANVLTASKR